MLMGDREGQDALTHLTLRKDFLYELLVRHLMKFFTLLDCEERFLWALQHLEKESEFMNTINELNK